MKNTNDQRNQEREGTPTGTPSPVTAAISGQEPQRSETHQMAGKQTGSAPKQGLNRGMQEMQSDDELKQSSSGMNAESTQHESQAGAKTMTDGESRRQSQRPDQRSMALRNWFESSRWMDNPFSVIRRFSDEMDRLFEDMWSGRGMSRSRQGDRPGQTPWSPQIEMYEKDNQLVICSDLPGLKQEDIQLEVSDDMLTIQGERRNEFEGTEEGYYRSERSYGSFSRMVPLPEGIEAEKAKASFENGVLKIMFPLPQQSQQRSRPRRIAVEGGSSQQRRSEGKEQTSQASTSEHEGRA